MIVKACVSALQKWDLEVGFSNNKGMLRGIEYDHDSTAADTLVRAGHYFMY